METTIKIMVLLVTSLMLFSCGGDDNQLLSPQDSGSPTIKTAHSNEELEAYLKTSLINNYATDITTRYEYSLASSDSSASPSSSSSTSFSVTNTQEPDVDEADRLKTDGTYLYTSSINKPEINIFETSNSSVTKIATYKLDTLNPDLSTLSGLYLRKFAQQLLALSDDGRQNFHIWDMWFVPNYWQNRKTEIFTLDVSDPSLPTQTNKVTLDGQLISSRRIGSTLYLATRHTPSIDGLITSPIDASELAKNKQLINQASISEMLPTYQFNNGSKQALFSEGDCFINDDDQASQQQSSVISLLAIDLDAVIPSPRGRCYVGDAETVYASGKALYLATTRYTYTEENGIAIYNGKPSTEIHKFSLNNTIPEYRGTGSVDGHLGWKQDLKPFRMSEHNEVLRVITYTGEQADSNHSPAHLYTLKENSESATLDILGTLPNDTRPTPLGKIGEQIYATRFVGTRAYLVTFRMTDPLYIVDLSNPADPFIASELEINGYSDYLHPIGDNYLLGIGKDAIPSINTGDGRGAWHQGVKLSLIDISDASAPFEKQQIILGKRGSETAVSRTHHAFTSLLKGDSIELAMPVSIHDTPYNGDLTATSLADPSYYYNWTRDELYRLSINTVSGAIEVLPAIESERQPSTDSEYYYSWEWPYDRSTIIDDTVYYLQGDGVLTN